MRPVRSWQAWSCITLGAAVAMPAAAQVAAVPAVAPAPAPASAEAEKAARNQAEKTSEKEAHEITDEVLSSTAPAFVAIGVSGQTITDPEGVKRFALAALSGVDADGKPVVGAGIQFSPAQLLPGLWVDYKTYKSNYAARALARLQFTTAYARADASDAGKPGRAAIGAIWVPFDTTDPFANTKLGDCLNDVYQFTPEGVPAIRKNLGTVTDHSEAGEAKGEADCRQKYARTPTNGYSAQLGIAKLFRSRDGGTGPLVSKGFAASAVMSIGLDCLFVKPCGRSVDPNEDGPGGIGGKLLLGAVFHDHELVINPLDDKTFIDRNRQSYGGRLLVGNPKSWWIGLEALYQHATYSGLGTDNYVTYSASLDVKVQKGQWFTLTYGDSSGANFGKSQQFTAGLKFAFGPSSALGGSN